MKKLIGWVVVVVSGMMFASAVASNSQTRTSPSPSPAVVQSSRVVASPVPSPSPLLSPSPEPSPVPSPIASPIASPVPSPTKSAAAAQSIAKTSPTPAAKVEAKQSSSVAAQTNSCDPNYSGVCVPIDSDVDCKPGSGNGPSYVTGPVTVIGTDKYGLDSDNDGIGCEKN